MDVEKQQIAAEVTHLKACINDVIGVVALPAIWRGGGPSEIVRTVLDAPLGRLDKACAKLWGILACWEANRG
jgi:hypothetical protein